MKDHPVALKGVSFVPATCACGHKGRSQQPKNYQCSGCYYVARAYHNALLAAKLRARAAWLEEDAKALRAKAATFYKKHRKKRRS